MKAINRAGLCLGLIGLLACGSTLADPRGGYRHGHGGWHGGLIISAPLFLPYYGMPYSAYPHGPYPYAYAPALVAPAEPPEYIEQSQEQATTPPRWYFCKDPKGYYPYVKQCPPGWQAIVPPAPSPN